MNAFETAVKRSDTMVSTTRATAFRMKQEGTLSAAMPGAGAQFGGAFSRDQSVNRNRYHMFRGWLYSAINALAEEAAGQPINVARITNTEPQDEERRARLGREKGHLLQKMPRDTRSKAANQEVELLPDHELVDVLENPNPIQSKWSFVYSFVANLNLTGWSFVVGDTNKDGKLELFSLPTTWVTPLHKEGPFSHFKVVNPSNPSSAGVTLDRSQVAFAHLPNPSDPFSALAPAATQIQAIRIDDHIQTSQERFFENGVFPSVVIKMGKDPHPNVPGGIRPRLSPGQRRQVTGAIRKVWGGVANYGNPAIVDGLIEGIERLSATQNEMGWEKSEDKIRTRILSAFGVHPFILGEPVSVGGYAQAAKIEERFCKRVNVFLGLLSGLLTNFVPPKIDATERLLIWLEKCVPHDPALHSQNFREGRKNGDVTQNEYRAFLGLPPDKDGNPNIIHRQSLPGIVQMLVQIGQGTITRESASAVLVGLGIPGDLAGQIAGGSFELQETLSVLQATLKELRQPVSVSIEDTSAQQLIKMAVDAASGAMDEATAAREDSEETRGIVQSLDKQLAVASVQYDAELRNLDKAVDGANKAAERNAMASKESAELMLTKQHAEERMMEQGQRKQEDILSALSTKVVDAFDVIQELAARPVEVLVTNEVVPAAVTVTNTIEPTPIEITNEVNPTPVEITNEVAVDVPETNVTVQGIEGKPGAKGDTGEAGAKGEKGDTPNVSVSPSIQVDVPPAEITVNLDKEPCPKTATITHSDGKVSQIVMEGEDDGQ